MCKMISGKYRVFHIPKMDWFSASYSLSLFLFLWWVSIYLSGISVSDLTSSCVQQEVWAVTWEWPESTNNIKWRSSTSAGKQFWTLALSAAAKSGLKGCTIHTKVWGVGPERNSTSSPVHTHHGGQWQQLLVPHCQVQLLLGHVTVLLFRVTCGPRVLLTIGAYELIQQKEWFRWRMTE